MSTFSFSESHLKEAHTILKRYPAEHAQSAVMPLLELAQKQNQGWLSDAAIRYVADFLGMPEIKVWEVAHFYSLYHLKPVGKHVIHICTTTPCWLRGSEEIMQACQKALHIQENETTQDGLFTLKEAECLAACTNAPMMQINDVYYEDLTPEGVISILNDLKNGRTPKSGSQKNRISSEGLHTTC